MQSLLCVHFSACSTEDVGFLVNNTLANFAAMIKTDSDKTVVVAILETLDDILKHFKKLSLPLKEEALDGLMTAVQDVLGNAVGAREKGRKG
jgi:hypothetical protein